MRQLEAEALDRSAARDQDNDRAALQEEVEQLQVENQVSALCSAACPLKGTACKDLHGYSHFAGHCHALQHETKATFRPAA